jgi:hypothetical protein
MVWKRWQKQAKGFLFWKRVELVKVMGKIRKKCGERRESGRKRREMVGKE